MTIALDDTRPLVMVCAWCPDKDARHAEIEAAGGRPSDGICPECRARYFPGSTHRVTKPQAQALLAAEPMDWRRCL